MKKIEVLVYFNNVKNRCIAINLHALFLQKDEYYFNYQKDKIFGVRRLQKNAKKTKQNKTNKV